MNAALAEDVTYLPPIMGADPQSLVESAKKRGPQAAMGMMQAAGRSLAEGKWSKYCHKLKDPMQKAFTALLLERTDQWIRSKSMDETTRVLQVGNFDKFAFPLVRAIYPNLIANEIVSVQPMAGPTSIIFYLDFVFGTNKGRTLAGSSAFDAVAGPANTKSYTSDDVPQESLGTGDGVAVAFPGNLQFTPVRPGTVAITFVIAGVTFTAVDNGSGTLVGTSVAAGSVVNYASGAITLITTVAPDAGTNVLATYRYDTEANENIVQVDLQLTSSPVNARSRKLRARWSLESAQNLNALHGLDAEAELVGVQAELIKFEIDREIIEDLYNTALAGSVSWPKTVPAGISFTEHKLSFIDALIEGSNLIYRATRRGQANFLVVSTGVSNVIESQPTFVPIPGALQTPGTTGIIKIGTLNNRWTVYKDPFLGEGLSNPDVFLIGYKGSSFLEAGYVYAPYIPLYTTPTIVLDDFIGRKGMATQYGKRVVNARFYATGNIVP